MADGIDTKEDNAMSIALHRVRRCLFPVALSVLSLALLAAGFVFSSGSAAAQTADSDADSYADDLERQLGSNPNDPDSTPESFALLWTCTDGNDNDRDGKRDFIDPGCRNTVPGSTTSPTSTPAAGGSSDTGANSGGSGSPSGGGGSSGGAPSNGGSGAGSENAVLDGSGSSIGGASGTGAGTDDASQTGSSAGQNSGDDTAHSDKSADAGLAPGTGTDTSQSDSSGDDGGFPWKTSLLLLALILIAGLIGSALLAARSRRLQARSRY
jgi:hypothetical protein